MEKLHSREVDVPTYYFGVNKTIGISYYKITFKVYQIQGNVLGTLFYFTDILDLSNGLSSDPNEDHM